MLVIKRFRERKKIFRKRKLSENFVQRGLLFYKEWSSIYRQENSTVTKGGPDDVRQKPMEFQAGDKVMLKVSPWKWVLPFGKRGKLNLGYIGPFKKCLSDEPLAISLDEIHIDDKLHFVEESLKIMDREIKRLKQSRIPIIKVRWNSRRCPEFIWEREDQFQKKYPHLLKIPHPRQVSRLEPCGQGSFNGGRL
ncbi:hypothetical protein Tco_0863014 [Tanacetum coccineum]